MTASDARSRVAEIANAALAVADRPARRRDLGTRAKGFA
jgi:hypothetical protein